jgi:NAD(P)-dependent dehydrogenase (short-subunit alcohol dehydrogenase family)
MFGDRQRRRGWAWRATSRRLAQLGVGVVIFEPERRRATALAEEIGGHAIAVQGDHNTDADVHHAIEVARGLGIFAINVNAAGISIPTPAVADADGVPHDMGIFREMIDLHLMGPFNMSRLCAAAFAANEPDEDDQRGVIINTSSISATDGLRRGSPAFRLRNQGKSNLRADPRTWFRQRCHAWGSRNILGKIVRSCSRKQRTNGTRLTRSM